MVIQPESTPTDSNIIPKWYAYFECQEDLVNYLLTFDELPEIQEIDAAAFYAPYVPLTGTFVINYGNVQPTVFRTRYDVLDSTSNSNSSI